MPSSRPRTSWRISDCPDRGHRAGVVARRIRALAQSASARCSARDRLGEDRLAGGEREALDNRRGSRCGAPRSASGDRPRIPFGVVPHPRGHVDHHRAGEARRRRAGEHVPEHGRAQRPADPDRALEGRAPRPARRRRRPSARRSGAAPFAPREAPWPRRSIAMIRKSAASASWRAKKPPCAISPCSSTIGVPLRRCRDRRSRAPSEAVKPCKTPPQSRGAPVRGSAAWRRSMPQSET